MFKLFKKMFATAEVDGVTFYSMNAFEKYMLNKERKRSGVHRYTFLARGDSCVAKCHDILEKNGIFDYKCEKHWIYHNYMYFHYYSTRQILSY